MSLEMQMLCSVIHSIINIINGLVPTVTMHFAYDRQLSNFYHWNAAKNMFYHKIKIDLYKSYLVPRGFKPHIE